MNYDNNEIISHNHPTQTFPNLENENHLCHVATLLTQLKEDTEIPALPIKPYTLESYYNTSLIAMQVTYSLTTKQRILEQFDAYQSILLHSCDLIDFKSGSKKRLIDETG